MKTIVSASVILTILAVSFYLLIDFGFQNQTDILVVESYHQGYDWDRSYKSGLEESLGNHYQLSYFEMDTKRVPQSQHQERADQAYDRYLNTKPSLVVLGDDNALKYLGPKLAEKDTPVVYLGINRDPADYLDSNTDNFTGVLERPLLERSLYTIKKVVGKDVKKILVLFDSGTTSKASLAHFFKGQDRISIYGITIDLKLIGDWDEWKQTVLAAKKNGYDAMIVGLYHTIFDASGSHIDGEKVLAWTSKNTTIPPFAFWDFTVGPDKAIGGLVLYGKQQGLAAGEIVKRILAFGAAPNEINPKIAERGRYLFSKAQLKKHGLVVPEDMKQKSEFVE